MVAPDEDERMALGVVKSNLAIKPLSLAWSREEDEAIVWHGLASQDVEDLLSGSVPVTPRADAEGFLREFLTGGSRASEEVERAGKEHGIAFRTLRRAAEVIDVKKFKEPGVLNGRWFWRLPDGAPRYAQPAPTSESPKMATGGERGHLHESPNLATPKDSHVAKLATFGNENVANGASGGHLHATTPIFVNDQTARSPNVMEGGQVGHRETLRGGQVPSVTEDGAGPDPWTHATRHRL
jgi:hypothetical protein